MIIKKLFSGLFFASLVSLCSGSAFANSNAETTINNLRFTTAGVLLLDTPAGLYWGTNSYVAAACPAVSLEVRKSWLAIAQASILSGRKIHIVFNTGGACGGYNYIEELWLMSY